MPNFCFEISTHQMNNTYNKLKFSISMKFHSKNQIKKMKEENVETWPAKKLNNRKTLRGGWSTVDMHGTWHPIPFDKDGNGMVNYEFDITWICSIEKPIRIRFSEKNCSKCWKEKVKRMAPRQNMWSNTSIVNAFAILGLFNIRWPRCPNPTCCSKVRSIKVFIIASLVLFICKLYYWTIRHQQIPSWCENNEEQKGINCWTAETSTICTLGQYV